jgi:transcriptional regulator with XRE-family HTH domain
MSLFTFGIVNKSNGGILVFYHNYVNQCNRLGMSPSAAAEAMGFKRSMVTRWSKGSQPRQATLQRMADFFKCSVDDLLEDKEKAAPEKTVAVSESDMRLIEWFRSLPKEKQKAILVAQDAPEGLV